MLESEFYRDDLVLLFHEKGKKTDKSVLQSPNAIFVWGELMDPEFIRNLLGHYVVFAPAVLKGYSRWLTKEVFGLSKKSGAVVLGVVLLDLSKDDIARLDRFEKAGEVMQRTTCMVTMGHIRRKTGIYRALGGKK